MKKIKKIFGKKNKKYKIIKNIFRQFKKLAIIEIKKFLKKIHLN